MRSYKVWLQGSDGKNYVISYEDLAQNLGLCELKRDLQHEIRQLERRVNVLEKPFRKREIINILTTEGPRTQAYLSRQIVNYDPSDLGELWTDGKVHIKKSGPHTLYEVTYHDLKDQ